MKPVKYKFKNPNIVTGTLSGTVYQNGAPFITFLQNAKNEIAFYPKIVRLVDAAYQLYLSYGKFDTETSELSLYWNVNPGESKVVANYEFDIQMTSEVDLNGAREFAMNDEAVGELQSR